MPTCTGITKKDVQCTRKVSGGDRCHLHVDPSIDECGICYNVLPLVKTWLCSHSFCETCMNKINVCAYCRQPLVMYGVVTNMLAMDAFDTLLLVTIKQNFSVRDLNADIQSMRYHSDYIGNLFVESENKDLDRIHTTIRAHSIPWYGLCEALASLPD
jgi:hypothetical protein